MHASSTDQERARISPQRKRAQGGAKRRTRARLLYTKPIWRRVVAAAMSDVEKRSWLDGGRLYFLFARRPAAGRADRARTFSDGSRCVLGHRDSARANLVGLYRGQAFRVQSGGRAVEPALGQVAVGARGSSHGARSQSADPRQTRRNAAAAGVWRSAGGRSLHLAGRAQSPRLDQVRAGRAKCCAWTECGACARASSANGMVAATGGRLATRPSTAKRRSRAAHAGRLRAKVSAHVR